jgi:hypothetical protein
MKKFLIVTASILGVAGVAVAADLPVRQPAPPPAAGLPVGKYPIGKAPIGKAPIGKGPVVAPAPAPGPITTRG